MCSLYELLLNKLPPSCGFAAPTNVMICYYSPQLKSRSQDLTRDSGQRVVLLGLRNSSEKLLFRFTSGGKVSIFVRKTLQVRPRDRAWAACRPRKLAGQELRFSMKMMLDAGSRNSRAACRNCLIVLGSYS
jgi:hypothetical protein